MRWRRDRSDQDFSEEVEAHLELETARLIEEGLAPDAARAAARKAFGNVTAARERFHEDNHWIWLEQFAQDLRYALRGLIKAPAFLATTVLTLAVGLGLVTVVFSVFNAYVLRPFPVRDPSALFGVGWRSSDDGGQIFRWRDYTEIRQRGDLFDGVLADDTRFVTSEGRTLAAAFVSTNYFETLAPRMALGRGLAGVDDRAPVAVLSHQAWMRLFAGDRGAVGRQFDVDGRPFTVIGVVRPEFTGIDDMPRDFWAPYSTFVELFPTTAPAGVEPRHLEITARLRNGIAPGQAQAALAPVMVGLVPTARDPRSIRADLRPQGTPNPLSVELLAVLSPIFAAFGLVLATACANVSNVMLSRAIARHREIAVRLSLGASRARVVRQLLTEGLVIAAVSAIAALALAAWTLRAGVVVLFSTLPPSLGALLRVAPLGFDRRVFAFAFAAAALATVLFALVPALQASRLPLTDALRAQRSGTRRGSKLRSALVIAQVAVSIVLVVAALTLARAGAAVGRMDPGFETAGVMSINVRGEDHSAIAKLAAALTSDPRVVSLAVSSGNPFFIRARAVAAAPQRSSSAATPTRYTFVSPEYFSILKIPIARGRPFRQEEARTTARVAIVSKATARAFWPGADPIGRVIRIEPPEGRPVDEIRGYSEVQVVGEADDVVSGLIVDGRDPGHIYLPTHANGPHADALLIQPRSSQELGPQALQELFRRVAADPQIFEALPLDEVRLAQVYPLRAASWIGAALGAIALVLSVTGVYGVLSYTLSQRTREIGIRMALGATGAAVVRLVMRQSAALAGIGAVIGLGGALAALAVLASVVRLNEVPVLDPAAFAGAAAAIAAAVALAAYQPARRATRVDPAETLRAEA